MENLKIRVTTEKESREVQKLFFKLGLRWYSSNKKYFLHTNKPYLCTEDGKYICFGEKISNFDDCDGKEITLQELRDMVKPILKEYLFKYNDQYTLVELSKEDAGSNPEQYIEIPEGANVYVRCNIFGDYKWLPKIIDGDWSVLWQREKESLNDKIATAEVARQEEKHSHYKKDVSHLKMIDPYRIADLYNLHPCADHIVKKSLCAGNRGHKDTLRDIQDIIDTAERWKQMLEEDSNEI